MPRLVLVSLLVALAACGSRIVYDDEGGDDAMAPDDSEPQPDRREEPCVAEVLDAPPPILWASDEHGIVVKLDTHTGEELARYDLGSAHDGGGFAVNARGDVLAGGGGVLTMILADDCVDANGIPGIQTSTGPEALPVGEDECVAWQVVPPNALLFGVAWAQLCGGATAHAWAVSVPSDPEAEASEVFSIDALTGMLTPVAILSDRDDSGIGWVRGRWSGVADAAGNYWAAPSDSHLFRVAASDQHVSDHRIPDEVPARVTIDDRGFIYRCGVEVARFDRLTAEWLRAWADPSRMEASEEPVGCVADPERPLLWLIGDGPEGQGAWALDRDTLAPAGYAIPFSEPQSVSIDDEGMVWLFNASLGQRIDPRTLEVLVTFDADAHGMRDLAPGFDATGRTAFAAGVR